MQKKARVLHIIPNLGIGGAERLVVNLLEALDKDKFEVAACSLYPRSGTAFEQQLEESRIPTYYLGKHKGLDLRMIPRLYLLFRALKPDIVHTHRYVLRYALIPMILCRIPARFHTVHSIAQKEVDAPGKVVNRLAFHFGKVVPISISKEVARTVQDLYKVQTPVVYNGILTEEFKTVPARRTWRENAGIKKSEIVFLHVGSFKPAKNHRLLLEAFGQAIKERSNLKLFLIGDGELRLDIEKLVKEKGLDHNIRFLGLRHDIPKLLAACDVFILSSDWEGVPMTILEAMAAGRPVISTSVGGVPELVEDGVTGILVPPGDVEALSQAILRLAGAPELRRLMGVEGQKRARERFNIARTAREYEALYLNLLEEGRKV